jgi:hypothetical protein
MNDHPSSNPVKALLLSVLVTAISTSLWAQSERSLLSRITSATVYNDRALVARVATGTFAAGKSSVKITGLPLLLNDQSVRISGFGTAQAKILEVRVEMALLDSIPDARAKELQNKLKAVQDEMRKLNDRGATLTQQRDFLSRISIASSENISKDLRVQRPTVEDWQKVLSFLDANQSRLNADQRDLDSKREDLQRKQDEIQFDLNNVGSPRQPREKQVFVLVDVTKEGKLDLEVSYLIQNASWQPIYNLRASTSQKRIELTYNAEVWQNTGEDWKDITLTLSTAQPVVGGSQPTLNTWFVDVYGGTKGAIQGFVRDVATGESLVGANVMIEGTGQGAAANSDGFFLIQNVEPGDYSVRVSYVGYRAKAVRAQVVPYQTSRVDIALDAEVVALQGIEVRAERPLVTQSATNALMIRGVALDAGVVGFQTSVLQPGATSTAFEVVAKTTVPSNNLKRKVTVTVASLSGDFKYSSVPKLQPRVYFKSTVTNSTDFPLLNGTTSVFVDNNYVSNSHMSTVMPGEKFDAFLGVDDGIRVERKILNKLTETTGFFSKSKKTTYDILIALENLKKTAETIAVQENIPISRNEKIKVNVELPKPDELQADADGFLKWNLELKPGEKKELHLKFSIEYPTDFTISALE